MTDTHPNHDVLEVDIPPASESVSPVCDQLPVYQDIKEPPAEANEALNCSKNGRIKNPDNPQN